MNKKNIFAIAMAAMMLSALAACGEEPSSETAADTQVTETSAVSQEDAAETETPDAAPSETPDDETPDIMGTDTESGAITFDYIVNGTTIVCGDVAQPVLDALGTPDSTFDAPSCAFEGTSYYYSYGGMQVVTYPDENDQTLNRIYEVDLNDDTVATNEGIHVGNTYDDVIAAYGTPDQEAPACLTYKTEGKAVQFFLEGDEVTTIIYTVVI
ncbi:MAG: hypothetical protein MJ071_05745 [Oscillospiraceae bacterium]|nr:hypothetical protein [Oscillospiraceae bacterium]